jgi:hypothetical protein
MVDVLSRFDHLNLNVDTLVHNVRDIHEVLESLPACLYADNAVLSGVIAGFNSERSMAQSYEDFLNSSSEFHVELVRRFDDIQQLFSSRLLTSQTLDEFHGVLASLVEVQSSMSGMISTNRAECEGRPRFN